MVGLSSSRSRNSIFIVPSLSTSNPTACSISPFSLLRLLFLTVSLTLIPTIMYGYDPYTQAWCHVCVSHQPMSEASHPFPFNYLEYLSALIPAWLSSLIGPTTTSTYVFSCPVGLLFVHFQLRCRAHPSVYTRASLVTVSLGSHLFMALTTPSRLPASSGIAQP